jgi:hypothetical protein
MKSGIVAELLLVRQHFFRFVCGCRGGFIRCKKFWQAFFKLFLTVLAAKPASRSRNFTMDGVSQCAPEVTILLPKSLEEQGVELKVANVLLARVPSENPETRAIPFREQL